MKIKMYSAVAVLVLVPAPAAAAPPVAPVARSVAEWPQAGFGPGNNYYNPGESRLNASTIDGVRERWVVANRSSSNCEVGIGPVLSGGRLFTSDPGGIGAYDPVSGRRIWHVALDHMTVSRLAVADGRVLLLSSECRVPARYQSHLSAYDPATGRRIWTAGLAKFSYDLRVDRGTVVLDSNQDGVASTIAYRVADGAFRWLLKGDRGDGLVSAGGRLLLRTAAGGAKAVSIADGRVLWKTAQNWYAVGADPAGTVFYIDGPGLSAVDAGTGKIRWSTARHVAEVTTDGRHVYFIQARSLECLDAATGRKLFAVHLPRPGGRPVRAGGLLYTVTGMATPLTIADASTGRVRAPGVPASQYHPPVITGGWLYVNNGDELRAYY